ncbi:hypothetical protein BHYA_0274g00190 [Botrytis hyacinthi]|uniref:Uncharacterized protein n=1 Tax=Botrytis hyacinthi TaxID=278943 RepID=A0A4Z1G821_9HELO|nr:hypothetical protein BHYA_0274g00190 [Botrytis hyacinthi]
MQQFVHKPMMLSDDLLRGAPGFGEAFLRQWAANGANAITGDVNLTKGKALVAEVRRSIGNQNLYFLHLNVADSQSQVDLFQAAAKLNTHESIDAMVTNTGADENNSTFDSPLDNLGILEGLPCIDLKALEVNLIEVIYTTHLALHYLPKNSGLYGGHIPDGGSDTPILSTFGRAILAGVPLCKIEAVVGAGARLMASKIGGKAPCIGPRFEVGQDWNIVSGTLNGAKSGGIWEVYGQDFDESVLRLLHM